MKLITHKFIISEEELKVVSFVGKDHWVVPVIMMVEGVHDGSGGPLLYTAETLGSFASAWNGTPVVVGHPNDKDGEPVSANSPELVSEVVGRIYNTHMEGDKLKAEAWIDIAHLQEVSPEAYDYIREHKALEVSIGVFSEEIDIQGEFNNEEYRAVARNLRPDHLALLPGTVGACSWDDGCGVRVNQKLKKNEVKNLKTLSGKELLKEGVLTHIVSNETGFREIMQNVQQKLDQLDNDIRVHYLEDLFEDNFVYRVHSRESGETSYYQRDYTVKVDGSIDFTGEPVQVRKDVSFIEMESGKRKRTKFSNNDKIENSMEQSKGCPTKVDALIANEATRFTTKDKEWLSKLEESQLDLLLPKEAEKPIENVKKEDKKVEATKIEEVKVAKENGTVKINSEELKEGVKAILNEAKDPNEFIDNFMPEALRGQMKSGLKMYHNKREQLIKGIVANSSFKEDQLKGWDDADLASLHDAVIPESGEYTINGESNFSTNEESMSEEGKSMLGLNTKTKEE